MAGLPSGHVMLHRYRRGMHVLLPHGRTAVGPHHAPQIQAGHACTAAAWQDCRQTTSCSTDTGGTCMYCCRMAGHMECSWTCGTQVPLLPGCTLARHRCRRDARAPLPPWCMLAYCGRRRGHSCAGPCAGGHPVHACRTCLVHAVGSTQQTLRNCAATWPRLLHDLPCGSDCRARPGPRLG